MCCFEGCDRKPVAKGLCGRHYAQKREGMELKPIRGCRSNVSAGMLISEATTVGDCLLWKPEHKAAYGKVKHNGKQMLIHHVVFEHFYGELEPGSHVHHKCANSRCINPRHLERTSVAENVGEMLARKDYEAQIAHLKSKVAALEAQLEREWVIQ